MGESKNIELIELETKEKGASMLEYALLAALIAAVAVAAVTFLGTQASESFSAAGSGLVTSP